MTKTKRRQSVRAGVRTLLLIGALGACGNYLTGGEKTNDPNNQTVARNSQYFVASQENLWSYWGSDPARIAGIYSQQFHGLANQYGALDASYNQDLNTTNGTHQAIYLSGGLVDIRKLQEGSKAINDNLYLGIAQIMEGALMGTAADIFGDLVYSKSMQEIPNPPLDDQLTVYDSVQKVLSAGIANINKAGATDFGPGAADLVYGGDRQRWTEFAHTLKARFYMHTGEVRPAAYAQALAEAQEGISGDDAWRAFTVRGRAELLLPVSRTAARGGDLAQALRSTRCSSRATIRALRLLLVYSLRRARLDQR